MSHRAGISFRILDDAGQNRLEEILKEFDPHLKPVTAVDTPSDIFLSLLVELASNGIRANLKRAYFGLQEMDLTEVKAYHYGLETFKDEYTNIYKDPVYHAELERLDLSLEVEIDFTPERMRIHVRNNVELLPEEEKRIRLKLAHAMSSRDLVQFSFDHSDDVEGEGLGLAMVVQLIRYLGFDPGHFRVFARDGFTTARVELPFRDDYEPMRGFFPGKLDRE